MIIKRENWDRQINVDVSKPLILVINDIQCLFKYQRELIDQGSGDRGQFMIVSSDRHLNFETEVEIIPNIFTITINTRKTINYLHKKLVKEFSKSDYIIDFEDLKQKTTDFLDNLKKVDFINFTYDKEIDLESFLKLYDVRFSNQSDKPIELLNQYIDILKEVSRIKVVIVSFAFYFLKPEEIIAFSEYCIRNDVAVVFLEKEKPNQIALNDLFNIISLDEDICFQ